MCCAKMIKIKMIKSTLNAANLLINKMLRYWCCKLVTSNSLFAIVFHRLWEFTLLALAVYCKFVSLAAMPLKHVCAIKYSTAVKQTVFAYCSTCEFLR